MLPATDDDFAAIERIVEALQRFSPKDRQKILRWAAEKLGVAGTAATATAPLAIGDFNRVIHEHKHSNDRLFAAAVAYAHKFNAPVGFSRKFIIADDVDTAARQIGRSAPNYPSQNLINGAQAGLLKKVAHGKYALTAKGQRAVEATDKGRGPTAGKLRTRRRNRQR